MQSFFVKHLTINYQQIIRRILQFWANIIRYYTNQVHLRGLTKNQGFVCIAKPVRWAALPT